MSHVPKATRNAKRKSPKHSLDSSTVGGKRTRGRRTIPEPTGSGSPVAASRYPLLKQARVLLPTIRISCGTGKKKTTTVIRSCDKSTEEPSSVGGSLVNQPGPSKQIPCVPSTCLVSTITDASHAVSSVKPTNNCGIAAQLQGSAVANTTSPVVNLPVSFKPSRCADSVPHLFPPASTRTSASSLYLDNVAGSPAEVGPIVEPESEITNIPDVLRPEATTERPKRLTSRFRMSRDKNGLFKIIKSPTHLRHRRSSGFSPGTKDTQSLGKGTDCLGVLSDEPSRYNMEVGDLAWARFDRSPFWPARVFAIYDKHESPEAESCCVIWFGGNGKSYGFVRYETLEPFLPYFETRYNARRCSAAYQRAVALALLATFTSSKDKVDDVAASISTSYRSLHPECLKSVRKEADDHSAASIMRSNFHHPTHRQQRRLLVGRRALRDARKSSAESATSSDRIGQRGNTRTQTSKGGSWRSTVKATRIGSKKVKHSEKDGKFPPESNSGDEDLLPLCALRFSASRTAGEPSMETTTECVGLDDVNFVDKLDADHKGWLNDIYDLDDASSESSLELFPPDACSTPVVPILGDPEEADNESAGCDDFSSAQETSDPANGCADCSRDYSPEAGCGEFLSNVTMGLEDSATTVEGDGSWDDSYIGGDGNAAVTVSVLGEQIQMFVPKGIAEPLSRALDCNEAEESYHCFENSSVELGLSPKAGSSIFPNLLDSSNSNDSVEFSFGYPEPYVASCLRESSGKLDAPVPHSTSPAKCRSDGQTGHGTNVIPTYNQESQSHSASLATAVETCSDATCNDAQKFTALQRVEELAAGSLSLDSTSVATSSGGCSIIQMLPTPVANTSLEMTGLEDSSARPHTSGSGPDTLPALNVHNKDSMLRQLLRDDIAGTSIGNASPAHSICNDYSSQCNPVQNLREGTECSGANIFHNASREPPCGPGGEKHSPSSSGSGSYSCANNIEAARDEEVTDDLNPDHSVERCDSKRSIAPIVCGPCRGSLSETKGQITTESVNGCPPTSVIKGGSQSTSDGPGLLDLQQCNHNQQQHEASDCESRRTSMDSLGLNDDVIDDAIYALEEMEMCCSSSSSTTSGSTLTAATAT